MDIEAIVENVVRHRIAKRLEAYSRLSDHVNRVIMVDAVLDEVRQGLEEKGVKAVRRGQNAVLHVKRDGRVFEFFVSKFLNNDDQVEVSLEQRQPAHMETQQFGLEKTTADVVEWVVENTKE